MTAPFATFVWWDERTGFVHVGLDEDQCRQADAISEQIEAYMAGRASVFEHRNRAHLRLMSGRAELGLATMTGLPWSGGTVVSDGRHLPDVGADLEVRFSEYRPRDPWLMLQERDRKRASSRYVLATGGPAVIVYKGWAYGHEVLRAENHRALKYPCFALDVSQLHAMKELVHTGGG